MTSVTAVLMLPPSLLENPWTLLAASAFVPCVVEYLMHLYYERCFRVRYWDYSSEPFQLHGRICLPFALAWTALMPVAVCAIAPKVLPLLESMPPWVSFAVWMLLAADFQNIIKGFVKVANTQKDDCFGVFCSIFRQSFQYRVHRLFGFCGLRLFL